MKKVIISLIFLFTLTILQSFAIQEEFYGIGAKVIKDYNKKTYIAMLLPNSPAEKANIPLGGELLFVDGTPVKKLSIDEISNLIKGKENTTVKLTVRYKHKNAEYIVARKKIDLSQAFINDKKFMLHWQQVAPENMEDVVYIEPFNHYSKYLKEDLWVSNYWANRRQNFTKGYNACLSYPVSEQNACLMNLVNREIDKTEYDRQAEIQEEMARLQSVQNLSNTIQRINTNTQLNNINNSIQMQNMYLQNTNMQLYNINNSLNRL